MAAEKAKANAVARKAAASFDALAPRGHSLQHDQVSATEDEKDNFSDPQEFCGLAHLRTGMAGSHKDVGYIKIPGLARELIGRKWLKIGNEKLRSHISARKVRAKAKKAVESSPKDSQVAANVGVQITTHENALGKRAPRENRTRDLKGIKDTAFLCKKGNYKSG